MLFEERCDKHISTKYNTVYWKIPLSIGATVQTLLNGFGRRVEKIITWKRQYPGNTYYSEFSQKVHQYSVTCLFCHLINFKDFKNYVD